jgi:hypothetical protein
MTYERVKNPNRVRSAQIITKNDRDAFWAYCKQTAGAARARSLAKGVPCTVGAYFIDSLLVDQKWRCAVSGVELSTPREAEKYRKDPFGPSLDRIIPDLGYVPGNVRVVANIVNSAMNEWGLDSLVKLLDAMRGKSNAWRP